MIQFLFFYYFLELNKLNIATYHVDAGFVKGTKIGFWAFTCMALFGLGLSFIPESDGTLNLASVVIMLFCSTFLGGFGYYGYRTLKSFPRFSISVDEDGLWYTDKSKEEGLIPWTSIYCVQEKPMFQKLQLQDQNSSKLIDVHYQLGSFDRLRNRLAQEISANYAGSEEAVFKKSALHHMFNIITISAFIAIGVYGFINLSAFLFWGMVVLVLVFICLYEYCSGFHKLYISKDKLTAVSILRSKKYKTTDIKEVVMLDDFSKGSRIPKVCITFYDESKLKLPSLGRSALEIYTILKNITSKKSMKR